MGRIVLAVLGVVLALYVVFAFVLPAVLGLLKLALVVGVIGAVVFGVVMVMGRSR